MALCAAPVPSSGRAASIDRSKLYLLAGQMVVAPEPSLIVTVLGSCVAICLWDARLQVGGMNHYMLPYAAPKQTPSPRFGNYAWEQLLVRMSALGARTHDLRAGIFGGARVMESFTGTDHVGQRNSDLADRLLEGSGIRVVQRDVGGRHGRKLNFETDTGEISVSYL